MLLDAVISVASGLEDEHRVGVALGVQGDRAGQTHRGRRCCTPPATGLARPGRGAPHRAGSAPPHRCTRWSDPPAPAPRPHRRSESVPLLTRPGGNPVTAVPGLTPRSPEIIDGPVLVTAGACQHRERGRRPQPHRRLHRRRRRHRRPNDPRYKPHGRDGAHRQHRPDPTARTVVRESHRSPISRTSPDQRNIPNGRHAREQWDMPRAAPVLPGLNERRSVRRCRSRLSHSPAQREPRTGETGTEIVKHNK